LQHPGMLLALAQVTAATAATAAMILMVKIG
jgi:hypothetical protein